MNNGMTFGMEGPNITGWWVNPKNGDKFKAVDTFFEDNKLLVKTADGRILNYNQIQNYIKTDKPDSIPVQKPQPNKTAPKDDIPLNILAELEQPGESAAADNDLLIPDDDIYGNPNPGDPEPSIKKTMTFHATNPTQTSTDDIIIKKALDNKSEPSIKVSIDWKKFPTREIEMLKDIMDVSIDNIISYYTNNLDMTEILEGIKRELTNYILEKSTPEQQTKSKTKK